MNPTVRVVLDASALVSYARLAGIAVGELVAMVEEDDGASLVGIPAASFLAAHRVLDPDDRPRLVDLATKTDGLSVLLPLHGADAVEVAEIEAAESSEAGAGLGHAAVEARTRSALLATYRGDAARRWLAADDVLDL